MNERIRELADQCYHRYSEYNIDLEKFAELIVKRCLELCNKEHAGSIHTHAGAWNTAIKRCKESIETHFGVEEPVTRRLMGYAEREEGYYPMYEPEPGCIVTQAFILCKYCNSAIYHCMGPRYDAVCLTCYEKEPDERTN